MPHFFINSKNIENGIAKVNDEDNYKHLARSLRIKAGEKLLLIDENEVQYETKVSEVTKKEILAEIMNSYPSGRKLEFGLYLAQSPLRSDAQALIMEKATELGVSGVYPIYTDNCALSKDVIEKKIPKWQKIMVEASKQCERANIPTCYPLSTIDMLIESEEFDYIAAFCERCSDKTFKSYFEECAGDLFKGKNILVIVGPEGGFSQREFKLFEEKSISQLTLGSLILKAETAVVVGLGNIIYEYNNFKSN